MKFETFKRLLHNIKNLNILIGLITIKMKAMTVFGEGGVEMGAWQLKFYL